MAIRAIRLPKWVSAIRVIGRVATRIYATVHLDAVLAALVNSYCRPGWTVLVAQQLLRVVVADRIALAWRKRVAELAEDKSAGTSHLQGPPPRRALPEPDTHPATRDRSNTVNGSGSRPMAAAAAEAARAPKGLPRPLPSKPRRQAALTPSADS